MTDFKTGSFYGLDEINIDTFELEITDKPGDLETFSFPRTIKYLNSKLFI